MIQLPSARSRIWAYPKPLSGWGQSPLRSAAFRPTALRSIVRREPQGHQRLAYLFPGPLPLLPARVGFGAGSKAVWRWILGPRVVISSPAGPWSGPCGYGTPSDPPESHEIGGRAYQAPDRASLSPSVGSRFRPGRLGSHGVMGAGSGATPPKSYVLRHGGGSRVPWRIPCHTPPSRGRSLLIDPRLCT